MSFTFHKTKVKLVRMYKFIKSESNFKIYTRGTPYLEHAPHGRNVLCAQQDLWYSCFGSHRVLKIKSSKFVMMVALRVGRDGLKPCFRACGSGNKLRLRTRGLAGARWIILVSSSDSAAAAYVPNAVRFPPIVRYSLVMLLSTL